MVATAAVVAPRRRLIRERCIALAMQQESSMTKKEQLMQPDKLDKEVARAQVALDAFVAADGLHDEDSKTPPYKVRPYGDLLVAVPTDSEMAADCYLQWSPKLGEWLMVEGKAPEAGAEPWAQWWRLVKLHLATHGVDFRNVQPRKVALDWWAKGRSCVWYAHHNAEADHGKPVTMKPLCDCYGADCEKCT